VFKNKVDNKLQYITSERAKWREEIREIAHRLQSAEKDEIDKILCELKVKINTYGIANKDNVFQDAHIWKIIKTLENPQGSNIEEKENEIKKAKKILIEYLSCLLKHDWERSKGEVIGDNTIIISAIINILFFISIVICCVFSVEIDIKNFDIRNINNYVFSSIIIVTGVVAFINFSIIFLQIKIKNIQDNFIRAIIDKKNFTYMYMKSFKWPIVYIILWSGYLYFLYKKQELFKQEGFIFFIVFAIIYLFSLFLVYYLKISNENKSYIDYYNTINKIYEIEMCPNDCDRRDCPK